MVGENRIKDLDKATVTAFPRGKDRTLLEGSKILSAYLPDDSKAVSESD